MTVWFAERGPDLSAESLAVLRQYLIDAMGLLGAGFAPSSEATPQAASAAQASSSSSTDRF
jgi:hypothetical protein